MATKKKKKAKRVAKPQPVRVLPVNLADPTWRSAMHRKYPSVAVRWVEKRWQDLNENQDTLFDHVREGGIRILDYGCGRGFDADYMGAEKYDPSWHPVEPTGLFDIIFCTYVLNVMDRPHQLEVLRRLDELGAPGCVKYVTVRRDLPFEGLQRETYKQYYVFDGDMKTQGYSSAAVGSGFQIYVKSDYGEY